MKPDLVRHLNGENIGRFPVWMMRQAGRYLESYREVRKDHSFWEMVTTPDLATEVSLLPLKVLPLDAVIFFSDILTPPYGLGIPVQMKESVGPVLENPLQTVESFEKFESFNPAVHTPYVPAALRKIKSQIKPEMALFGFAGAPWTVGCYLIEGRSSRHFEQVKGWMHRDPEGLLKALSLLAISTEKYLLSQVEAGVDAVQLFDTWLMEMPSSFFRQYRDRVLRPLIEKVKKSGTRFIYYQKNAHHLLPEMAELPIDVLSVDSLISLKEAEALTGARFSLQGNLDPVHLLTGNPGQVRKATRLLVEEAMTLKKPAILNLGHGILPKTPFENAKAFVEEARTLWV